MSYDGVNAGFLELARIICIRNRWRQRRRRWWWWWFSIGLRYALLSANSKQKILFGYWRLQTRPLPPPSVPASFPFEVQEWGNTNSFLVLCLERCNAAGSGTFSLRFSLFSSLAFWDYRSSQSIKSCRLRSENNFEKYSIPRRVCARGRSSRASFHLPRFYICLMQTWYNACRNL